MASGLITMLAEKRANVFSQSQAILDRAESEHRGLTVDDQQILDAHNSDLDSLRSQIEAAQKREADQAQYSAAANALTGQPIDPRSGFGGGVEVRADRPMPFGGDFRDLPGGRPATGMDGAAMLGQLVQARMTGRSAPFENEYRASQAESTGPAGGFVVPTPVSTSILQAVVPLTGVRRAGATIVPMSESTLSLPRLDALPTPAWRAELAPVVESTATFGRVQLQAKTLACTVRVSMELSEDDASFGSTIQTALAQAAAIELDRVALFGSGASNQPLGLRAQLSAAQITALGANGGTRPMRRSRRRRRPLPAAVTCPRRRFCRPALRRRWRPRCRRMGST